MADFSNNDIGKRILKKHLQLFNKLDSIYKYIDKFSSDEIPNIVSCYRNKIDEIVELFKQSQISFENGVFLDVIDSYLINLINEASLALLNYVQLIRGYDKDREQASILPRKKSLANKITDLVEQLRNFSIAKDGVFVVKRDIMVSGENEHSSRYYLYTSDNYSNTIAEFKLYLREFGVPQEELDSIPDFILGFGSL